MKKKNKAVFADRDGTVNHEVGYLNNLKNLRLYRDSVKAIRMLKEAGYRVIVVTNQSGVARGYITEAFVKKTHKRMETMLKKHGLSIDAYYYCPHHRKKAVLKRYLRDCECRKPNLGMVKKAVKKFNLDLKKSFVVGDKLTDIKLGMNAKMKSILVLTGYGKQERRLVKKEKAKPDFIAKNFFEAAKLIAASQKKER